MTGSAQTHAKGYLEVGINDSGEVVINHPDLCPDENGVGHIVFSPAEARNLSQLLWQKANEIDRIPPFPSDRTEAGKPRFRWARLIVTEGSEAQIAHHKAQSMFSTSRKMGNVTCTVLVEEELRVIENTILTQKETL